MNKWKLVPLLLLFFVSFTKPMEQEIPAAKKRKIEEEVLQIEPKMVESTEPLVKPLIERQAVYNIEKKESEVQQRQTGIINLNEKEFFSQQTFKKLIEDRFAEKLPFILVQITQISGTLEQHFYFEAYDFLKYLYSEIDKLAPLGPESLPAIYDNMRPNEEGMREFAKLFVPDRQIQLFFLRPTFIPQLPPVDEQVLRAQGVNPPYLVIISRYNIAINKFPPNPVTKNIIEGKIKFYVLNSFSDPAFVYTLSDFELSGQADKSRHQFALNFIMANLPNRWIAGRVANMLLKAVSLKGLGQFYFKGKFVQKDNDKAKSYLNHALELLNDIDSVHARNAKADIFLRLGDIANEEKQFNQAEKHYQVAADSFNNPLAQLKLIEYYYTGIVRAPDYQLVKEYAKKVLTNPAPNAGFFAPMALVWLAKLHANNTSGDFDLDLAKKYLEAATQGQNKVALQQALGALGQLYYSQFNYPKAASYLSKAVVQDDDIDTKIASSFLLGKMYFQGQGVDKDDAEAQRYLLFAAQQSRAPQLKKIAEDFLEQIKKKSKK